jgi:hypothetical protein
LHQCASTGIAYARARSTCVGGYRCVVIHDEVPFIEVYRRIADALLRSQRSAAVTGRAQRARVAGCLDGKIAVASLGLTGKPLSFCHVPLSIVLVGQQ